MVRVPTHENHVGHADREHAIPRRSVPARHALEQVDVLAGLRGRQRQQKVFLAREVLVQGADRVLAFLGDPRHLQAEQPVLADQLVRGVEEQLLPLRELPTTTFLGAHDTDRPDKLEIGGEF